MNLEIRIVSAEGMTRARQSGQTEAVLVHDLTYAPGDMIEIACDGAGFDAVLQLDAAIAPALVHAGGPIYRFAIPFDSARVAYPAQAFAGPLHRISIRPALPSEAHIRRNLALNPADSALNDAFFPHAFANVETRNEAGFAARNAIDGEIANHDHGFWPYTSWGINRDPHASLTLDFGRAVWLDEIALRLRADFPHDSWWERATIVFSEGPEARITLHKTGQRQAFAIPPRQVTWLRLEQLTRADDPSPFPALTQIEAWGWPVTASGQRRSSSAAMKLENSSPCEPILSLA
ncbi:hypothetical protein ACEUZ9_000594 [Paracoccus litorisediminis]|uniref:carbohydrate-binding protein n=1 Tax=Paracoccus litorisediminis TaxID=2006130 RepID=UPI0037304D94